MQKKREDIINGNLWSAVLAYAFPLAATGVLQQLFNAADVAVVGQFTGDKGEAAMAAVGANSPVIGLIVNSFIGISLGSNVVIANHVGRQDKRAADAAAHTSLVVAFFFGIILSVFGELMAVPILSSQNVPEEVLPMAVLYFRVYMLGLPVIMLYNFEAAIYRAVGNTKTPLNALIISGSLNVALNIFFVLGLKRTVDGVAMATVISNAVSFVILLRRLLSGRELISIKWRQLRIDGRELKRILGIGIPAGVQSAVFSLANIIIQSAINSLGTVVMAASSAAFNLEVFAYQVLNSFSQACTTFVGQNYGAGKISRCKKSLMVCMLEGCLSLGIAIGLVLGFGRLLLSVFNSKPDVIEVGYQRLIYIFSAYFFTLTYEVVSGYLRGFGISLAPALITIICVCGVRITWIYKVFPGSRSFRTIMLAYPLSLSLTAIVMVVAALILHPAAKHEKSFHG